MTENEINEVGQLIQRCVPKGSAWIVVIVPPHAEDAHAPGFCPLQTASNLDQTADMHRVLAGAAEMFETGAHLPMFTRPVEKGN